MAGYADCLSTTAPNLENMDSLFDITASKHVDGVTSRSISNNIPSQFLFLPAFLQERERRKLRQI